MMFMASSHKPAYLCAIFATEAARPASVQGLHEGWLLAASTSALDVTCFSAPQRLSFRLSICRRTSIDSFH